MEELTQLFSLERVVKSGSRFDPEKAKWFNRHYFQQKTKEELAQLFKPVLKEKGMAATNEKITAVVAEIKERCEFVSDLWEQGNYFFVAPTSYDEKTVKKRWREETPEQLTAITALFDTIENWKAEEIKEAFSAFMNDKGWGFGAIMNPLRLSLVGGNMGPDLFKICEILGREETVQRIETAVNNIQN